MFYVCFKDVSVMRSILKKKLAKGIFPYMYLLIPILMAIKFICVTYGLEA